MPELYQQSRDYLGTPSPPSTPVAKYPRTAELHLWSRDYSGTTAPLWQSIPVLPELHWHSRDYPGSLGLPSPIAPVWQSISVHQSYTGSPVIIPGRPPSPPPLWQSIPVHSLYWQSLDYPLTTSPPHTCTPLCESIPESHSYSGGPGISLGLLHPKSPYAEYLRNE